MTKFTKSLFDGSSMNRWHMTFAKSWNTFRAKPQSSVRSVVSSSSMKSPIVPAAQ
jgi:hypothetical protein